MNDVAAAAPSLHAGLLHHAAGQWAAARSEFEAVAAITPDSVETWDLVAAAARNEGDSAGAVRALRKSLILSPDRPDTWRFLGDAYYDQGKYSHAWVCYTETLMRNPNDAEARIHAGNTAWGQGRVGMAATQWALATNSTHAGCAKYNLSRVHEINGDWPEAWRVREHRWQCAAYRAKYKRPIVDAVPQWTGEQIFGPLLVWSEEGAGDMIQNMRFVTALQDRVPLLICEVPKGLVSLCSQSFPGVQFITRDTQWGGPAPTHHLPSASLLYHNRQTTQLPAPTSYLVKPEPALPKSGRLRIGICWAGSDQHPRDRERSMTAKQLLGCLPSCAEWVSLQVGETADHWMSCEVRAPIAVLPPDADYLTTAGFMACCDVVVSVDTSCAHLAGALGCRVLTLLPHFPDPRWMLERTDTPLYSTMSLVRQEAAGEWGAVVAKVRLELESLC